MAVGWIGLLKNVPWRDVVSNAPKIAGGAKTLWNSVSKKIHGAPDDARSNPDPAPENESAMRIARLENDQRELRDQLARSSELIASLAEQNTQLVARLDAVRRGLRWLAVGLLVAGGLALAALLRGS